MKEITDNPLNATIKELQSRLEEAEQLIEAIKAGEVDAFAINKNSKREIFTLESSDYAYRLLIEQCGEGAVNVSDEGLILYTNRYFCQLLNLPYEQVIGHQINDFITTDSQEVFIKLFKESFNGNAKGEANLAGSEREIPVYISLTSLQPRLPTIGIIVTDLTEKKNHEKMILSYQKSLELKNTSLGKMNTELQSFAHISSHDLQEPVRKMQMITSRIIESEYDNLTTTGRDLLLRMQNSAKRLHALINDLLAYSTTDYEESSFESVSLQHLINDVSEDFMDDLEKEHLIIETQDLCSINIIPLHFRQVMHNLISNSLKFSNPGKQVFIRITCSTKLGSDYEVQGLNPSINYTRIKYTDNGIGFDPAYNEKIFGLFQRLHSKEKFKGTGIGLSIVKKIIENHNGLVTAEGKPGEGAEFNIFIPHQV